MNVKRRTVLGMLSAVPAAGTIRIGEASAQQDFPSRPIRLIAPAPPGGVTDITARLLAQRLADVVGQQVIVENRSGGGGNIAAEHVARSRPDGYTLLVGTIGTHAINRSLYPSLPFDPERDFAPITQIVTYPLVLVVNPGLGVATVQELIAAARARPGQLMRASGGSGTSMHLSGELFQMMARLDMPHVPYRGSAPALTDVVSGQAHLMFDALASAVPLVQAGRLRAIAQTGAQRSPVLPDVPTVAEAGLTGYDVSSWLGLLAPAGTPAPVVERLHRASVEALSHPEIRQRFAADGGTVVASTPEAFAAFMRAETAKWADVVRASGARAD